MTTPRAGLAGSDEAVEAATHALSGYSPAQFERWRHTSRGQRYHDQAVAALRAAEPFIAARVHAEAVAEERQRIAELVTAALVPDDMDEWSDNNEGWNRALGRVLRDLRAAAGSVPVATPPESDPRCPADLEGARCSLFRGHQDNHATSFGKRGQDALGRSYDGAWFEWADVAVPVATPTSEREQAGGDGLRSVSRTGQQPGRLPVEIGHTSDTELLQDALRGWIDQRSSAFSAEDFDVAGSLLHRVDAVLAVPVATPEPCDHGHSEGHRVTGTNQFGYGSASSWCAGPVATPAEQRIADAETLRDIAPAEPPPAGLVSWVELADVARLSKSYFGFAEELWERAKIAAAPLVGADVRTERDEWRGLAERACAENERLTTEVVRYRAAIEALKVDLGIVHSIMEAAIVRGGYKDGEDEWIAGTLAAALGDGEQG